MPEPTIMTGSTPPVQASLPLAPAPSQQPAPSAAKVIPGSPEWSQLPAEQRHAQLRGPANPRAQGHSPARDVYEAQARARGEAPAAIASDQQPPAAEAGPKIKVGKFEVSEAELAAIMTRQSADDLRKAQVPPTPADYKIQMDAPVPVGVDSELIFDQNDPMAAATLDAARQWAHGKGLSQTEFSELLGVYANGKAAEISIINRAAAAEREKLGAMGGARVDALTMWIRGEAGDANAKIIVAGLACAAQVEFMEKVMSRLTNQGGASFSQSHRAPPDTDGKIPNYDKMSFEQRRLAQDQLAARRTGR